ncbi:MAG: hypothetical protein DSY42_05995 [Aquifex sp.]|nr:MAG: hypothetical protein DSY42_05995 [Aquifex sp.]
MREEDVMNAKSYVENLAAQNGLPNLYVNGGFGVYINLINRTISVHGPRSADWQKARSNPTNIPHVFNKTSNGFWVGGFRNLFEATAFAKFLKDYIYRTTGETMHISAGKDVFQNIKLF